jgi:hypothetical protein
LKVLVLQFDNRPVAKLGLLPFLVQRNKAYAAAQGYDYRLVNSQDVDLPVYWLKPLLVARMLEQGYDIVAWVDTDAVFHDHGRRIEDLFENGEAMVAAGDNPFWRSAFNAGVFFVRGPGGGLALMRRWSALFAGTAWRRTETAWICDAEWSGPDFEQGAFVQHLLPELIAAGTLRLIDWRALQAPFPIEDAFTLHFAGGFKANIPAYLHLIN